MPRARDAVLGRLTLKQLRLVVAVHQHLSILAASRALGLSQPAATRLIKETERSLGCVLFARTNRGVRATDRGEALVRHGKLVLAQLAHAGEELDDLAEGTGGRVAVGTLLAASARLLPAAIARLRRDRPRVAVTVVEGTNDRLVPALAAGDLDFIVGRLPEFRHRDELVHEPLLVEDSCVVVRAGHPLARRRRLTLADLASADWIMPLAETTLRRQVEKAFHDAGLDAPRPAVQSLSVLTNRALLLATDMIGVWPRQVVLDDVRGGVLAVLPVALPPTAGPIGIARRRGAMLSPAASALCDALKREAQRALPPPGAALMRRSASRAGS
jgi:DNA-binding transcriptional LysR family regulator